MRMIWKHYHCTLLIVAGLMVVTWITRPDFEHWHLLPSVGLWGGGHVIIIRLGRRMSPERAALKERLEMDKMMLDHVRKMRSTWLARHIGAVMVLSFLLGLGGFAALAFFSVYGPEGVREWLSLFG